MTALAPELDTATHDGDDEVHVVCCRPDVALCGSDVTALAWVDDDAEATCVVCADLEGLPCRRCNE